MDEVDCHKEKPKWDRLPRLLPLAFIPVPSCRRVPTYKQVPNTIKVLTFRLPYIPIAVRYEKQYISEAEHADIRTCRYPYILGAVHFGYCIFRVPYISVAEHFGCCIFRALYIWTAELFECQTCRERNELIIVPMSKSNLKSITKQKVDFCTLARLSARVEVGIFQVPEESLTLTFIDKISLDFLECKPFSRPSRVTPSEWSHERHNVLFIYSVMSKYSEYTHTKVLWWPLSSVLKFGFSVSTQSRRSWSTLCSSLFHDANILQTSLEAWTQQTKSSEKWQEQWRRRRIIQWHTLEKRNMPTRTRHEKTVQHKWPAK